MTFTISQPTGFKVTGTLKKIYPSTTPVTSDVFTHWSYSRDGSPEQPQAGLADLDLAMLPHPSSGSAIEALAVCNLPGRTTWPGISAQCEVPWRSWAVAAQHQGCHDGLRGGTWTPVDLGAVFCSGKTKDAMALLSACYHAGLCDSASFPAIYFLWIGMSCSWIEQLRAKDLSLLRASLDPWPEHSCWRQQRRESERMRWWTLSQSSKEHDVGNKRFSSMSCSYLSLSLGLITDPLTLEISCDNRESQNSWGWKGPSSLS